MSTVLDLGADVAGRREHGIQPHAVAQCQVREGRKIVVKRPDVGIVDDEVELDRGQLQILVEVALLDASPAHADAGGVRVGRRVVDGRIVGMDGQQGVRILVCPGVEEDLQPPICDRYPVNRHVPPVLPVTGDDHRERQFGVFHPSRPSRLAISMATSGLKPIMFPASSRNESGS